MKANVIKILSAIANLLNWAITGVNYRRRAKRCAAYRRGWCKAEYCGICASITEEEADVMQENINQYQNRNQKQENEI